MLFESEVLQLVKRDRDAVVAMDNLSYNYVEEWLDSGHAYGLFVQGNLASYCTLGYADECGELIDSYKGKTHDSLILSNLYTAPNYRGKKCASTLVYEILKLKDELIFLMLLHDDLIRFYERLGFEHIGDNVMVLDNRKESVINGTSL